MPARRCSARQPSAASRRRRARDVICANKNVTVARPARGRAGAGSGLWRLVLHRAVDRQGPRPRRRPVHRGRRPVDRERQPGRPRALRRGASQGRGPEHRRLRPGPERGLRAHLHRLRPGQRSMPPGFVGSALTVAPYVVLARNAVPGGGFAALTGMTLSAWERAVGYQPPPPQRAPGVKPARWGRCAIRSRARRRSRRRCRSAAEEVAAAVDGRRRSRRRRRCGCRRRCCRSASRRSRRARPAGRGPPGAPRPRRR